MIIADPFDVIDMHSVVDNNNNRHSKTNGNFSVIYLELHSTPNSKFQYPIYAIIKYVIIVCN